MKTLIEKLHEKELQIEAMRAQIAKLEKDIETLQSAARILSDEDDASSANPLADLMAPELSAKAAAMGSGDQKSNNGFDPQGNKKKAWP
jgi:hypothetical protein